MARKIHWHLMSWQEIREAQKENPVILIPAGTVETQGPYTYIGLECVVPERLAEAAWRTNREILFLYVSQPGGRAYWDKRRGAFDERFRDMLDEALNRAAGTLLPHELRSDPS